MKIILKKHGNGLKCNVSFIKQILLTSLQYAKLEMNRENFTCGGPNTKEFTSEEY